HGARQGGAGFQSIRSTFHFSSKSRIASVGRASSALKAQSALAGAVRQRCNASVVLVTRAVENHALDAGRLGTLGDKAANLLGLLGLVPGRGSQIRLHGGGGDEGAALRVVDDLRGD